MTDKAANKHVAPTPSPLLMPSPLQKDEIDSEKLPIRPLHGGEMAEDRKEEGTE